VGLGLHVAWEGVVLGCVVYDSAKNWCVQGVCLCMCVMCVLEGKKVCGEWLFGDGTGE